MKVSVDNETNKMLAARFGEEFANQIQANLDVKNTEVVRRDNKKKREQKDRAPRQKERKPEK